MIESVRFVSFDNNNSIKSYLSIDVTVCLFRPRECSRTFRMYSQLVFGLVFVQRKLTATRWSRFVRHCVKSSIENGKFYALKVVELTPYSSSTCHETAIYRETNHRNVMKILEIFFDHLTRQAWLHFDYAGYDLHAVIIYYRNLYYIHSGECQNQLRKVVFGKYCMASDICMTIGFCIEI